MQSAGTASAGIGEGNIGKAALCEMLGWSRPKLDRTISRDSNFPVAQRGSQAGGWEFNPNAVRAYLNGDAPAPRRADPPAPAAEPQEEVQEAPEEEGAPVLHRGEKTARERRDVAQAAILEAKLLQTQGELLRVDEVKDVLGLMLAHLAKGLDGLPERIIKRLQLRTDIALQIRDEIDQLRRTMSEDLRSLLDKVS